MELLVILYSEDMLGRVYKVYQLHQAKHNLPFMRLEDYRILFEEQQQVIIDQIDLESDGVA
tara:strand:+ start:194 stop:376 length:183 start_codon:yes stop_codon:yes gene_type:complete